MFGVAGAHASCFGLHLRSALRAAAITHRKDRVGSTSMFPRGYKTRRRSENNPRSPALRHDVIPSSQGVGFIVHALFSRLLFMSRET